MDRTDDPHPTPNRPSGMSRPVACFAAIAALALATRAGWAAVIPIVPTSDGALYDRIARNLVAGHGYCITPGEPIAYWPPGAPMLFAACHWAFGPGHAGIAAAQVALSTSVVLLTMGLARRWFGDAVAALAGLLLAIWPSQVQYATVMATEVPFQAATLLGLVFWSQSGWPSAGRGAAAGLCLGLASLIRPPALLLPAVLGLSSLATHRRLGRAAMECGVAMLVTAAVVSPWTLRNAKVLGHVIPISSNSGTNLWMGNHPGTTGGYTKIPERFKELDPYQRSQVMGKEAVDEIKARPVAFLGRSLKKVALLHNRETIGVVWNAEAIDRTLGPRAKMPLKVLSTAYWYAVLGLGLVGASLLIAVEGPIRGLVTPTVLFWAYFTAVHAVVIARQDRFHFPSVPMIAILAGLALRTLVPRLGLGRATRSGTPPLDPRPSPDPEGAP